MNKYTIVYNKIKSDESNLSNDEASIQFNVNQNWNRMLIVFDYTGTLARRIGKQDYSIWNKYVLGRRVNTYNASQMNDSQNGYIFHRPGIKELQEFFTKNSEFISYSLWTYKNEDSMSFPLEQLKTKFNFIPENCWFGAYFKDLREINKGYNIDNILLVDNNLFKAYINKNYKIIKNFDFEGNELEEVDDELFKLIDYLSKVLNGFKRGKTIKDFMGNQDFSESQMNFV